MCSSLNILWYCLSLGLEWKLTFSSPVATAECSRFAGTLRAALSHHHVWVQPFPSVTASIAPLVSLNEHGLLGWAWPSQLSLLKLPMLLWVQQLSKSKQRGREPGGLWCRPVSSAALWSWRSHSARPPLYNAVACDCWENVQWKNPCEG